MTNEKNVLTFFPGKASATSLLHNLNDVIPSFLSLSLTLFRVYTHRRKNSRENISSHPVVSFQMKIHSSFSPQLLNKWGGLKCHGILILFHWIYQRMRKICEVKLSHSSNWDFSVQIRENKKSECWEYQSLVSLMEYWIEWILVKVSEVNKFP